jgi:hypothetical protein
LKTIAPQPHQNRKARTKTTVAVKPPKPHIFKVCNHRSEFAIAPVNYATAPGKYATNAVEIQPTL